MPGLPESSVALQNIARDLTLKKLASLPRSPPGRAEKPLVLVPGLGIAGPEDDDAGEDDTAFIHRHDDEGEGYEGGGGEGGDDD